MPKRYAREFRRDICERLVASSWDSPMSRDIPAPTTHYVLNSHTVGGAQRCVETSETCRSPLCGVLRRRLRANGRRSCPPERGGPRRRHR